MRAKPVLVFLVDGSHAVGEYGGDAEGVVAALAMDASMSEELQLRMPAADCATREALAEAGARFHPRHAGMYAILDTSAFNASLSKFFSANGVAPLQLSETSDGFLLSGQGMHAALDPLAAVRLFFYDEGTAERAALPAEYSAILPIPLFCWDADRV